jgi:hypothetical protein
MWRRAGCLLICIDYLTYYLTFYLSDNDMLLTIFIASQALNSVGHLVFARPFVSVCLYIALVLSGHWPVPHFLPFIFILHVAYDLILQIHLFALYALCLPMPRCFIFRL